MQKTCINDWCKTPFEVTNDDLAFYDKVSPVFGGKKFAIPPPILCPDCRLQKLLYFRNERRFYPRLCDSTQQHIVSLYSPDKKQVVYDQQAWWSEAFDPLSYGQPVSLNTSFLQQLHELERKVPKVALLNTKSENCTYTHFCAENKNCYMLCSAFRAEECHYAYRIFYSKNVLDSYDLHYCELCYECLCSEHLYNCIYSDNCHNSSDLAFCSSCTGCTDCIGCINLRNKKYHIFNQPFDEQSYRKMVSTLLEDRASAREQSDAFKKTQPHKASHIRDCENSTGDYLTSCKNCHDVYRYKESEDCSRSIDGYNCRNCMDVTFGDSSELQYMNTSIEQNYQVICGNTTWYSQECTYAISCQNSHHLFGCVGMKNNAYCILNKQHTKEEYEMLVPKIIGKMMADGEWGEFFPVSMSPFGYNETVAHEDFPLKREEALARGFLWSDYEAPPPEAKKVINTMDLPNTLEDIPDDIVNWAIICKATQKPFKIIKQELDFYRTMKLPIPRLHPDERHKRRMALRNPRKLWNRECAKCSKPISTSYAPERPEIVYCEECYLKEVY